MMDDVSVILPASRLWDSMLQDRTLLQVVALNRPARPDRRRGCSLGRKARGAGRPGARRSRGRTPTTRSGSRPESSSSGAGRPRGFPAARRGCPPERGRASQGRKGTSGSRPQLFELRPFPISSCFESARELYLTVLARQPSSAGLAVRARDYDPCFFDHQDAQTRWEPGESSLREVCRMSRCSKVVGMGRAILRPSRLISITLS